MTDTLVTERIEANLTRLRLPRIREILDQTIQSAEEKGQSYLSFLDDLLEEEVAQKEQRRIETALKISYAFTGYTRLDQIQERLGTELRK